VLTEDGEVEIAVPRARRFLRHGRCLLQEVKRNNCSRDSLIPAIDVLADAYGFEDFRSD
jgi:hypothetical protein